MKKTVVYIVATTHSGSTLIDVMLGSHSKGTSLGEFMRSKKFGKVPIEDRCKCCRRSCAHWNKFCEDKKRIKSPHEAAFNAFETPIIIDSSKKVKWLNRTIPRLPEDIDYKIIRLYRSFGGNLYTPYLGKSPDKISGKFEIKKNLIYHRKLDKTINRVAENSSGVAIVYYEDLAKYPEETLKDLCLFLDIEFEKGMLSYWKYDHHLTWGSSTTIGLIKRYQNRKDESSIAASFLGKFGVSISCDERYKELFGSARLRKIVRYDKILRSDALNLAKKTNATLCGRSLK